MRYAILSDVHGRRKKLASVLAHTQALRIDRVISLGDIGREDCLALLLQARAQAVFGNYEVSGWRHLATEYRAWVRSWPPLLAEDGFLAVHAAPWWPAGLHTVEDFGAWLQNTGLPWRTLFPYLTDDDKLVYRALAELEAAGKMVLFHGHTHQQTIWCWGPDGHLHEVHASSVRVQVGHHYLVGVGSVGLPEDGAWSAYALYDSETDLIELMGLTPEASRTNDYVDPEPRNTRGPAR